MRMQKLKNLDRMLFNEANRKQERQQLKIAAMRGWLDELAERYHSVRWLDRDPLWFAHQYSGAQNREVVALISASFAYGSVDQILAALGKIFAPLGTKPATFLMENWDGADLWSGFYYRFHRSGHVWALLLALRKILIEYGSLGAYAKSLETSAAGPPCGNTHVEKFLNVFCMDLRERVLHEAGERRDLLERGIRFFFSAPLDRSACKRMLMFLRWMVRSDELDLGLWSWISPAELIIPVDTHVGRISRYIGLRKGAEGGLPNWKMAIEITESLRAIRPSDPVYYDFAIAHLGILDLCTKRFSKSVCSKCALLEGCQYATEA